MIFFRHNNFIYLLIFLVFSVPVCSKNNPIKIAFWNVENLFDLKDDPLKNDEDFLIGAKKNVTLDSYNKKLDNLSEVINIINADLIGLCEVENYYMFEELSGKLKTLYDIVHYESPDKRGIDVGVLFNKNKVKLIESNPIKIELPNDSPTRDILYLKFQKDNFFFHLYVNHWPSKYGGAKKTIPLRIAAAQTLRNHIDGILAINSHSEIIVIGDLNDEPDDLSVLSHLRASIDPSDNPNNDYDLFNMMMPWHKNPKGSTYTYGGIHMVYDHIILSKGFFDKIGLKYVKNSVGVFDGDKYRQHGGKYDGYPYRFWAGNRILGGYSDHMPIFISIE